MKKTKTLILCTGNSCRSHMAEGILRDVAGDLFEVFSAGSKPAGYVHPLAIEVLNEIGIDISGEHPKSVDQFIGEEFDYVVTVCDGAREVCPVFTGKVMHRLHIGFEDPSDHEGPEEEVLPIYRKVRDQIRDRFLRFPK